MSENGKTPGTVEVFDSLEKKLRQRYYGWSGVKQFDGTSERLQRAFEEFCWTTENINAEVEKALISDFVDSYDETLVEGPIEVWTLCPHHLLPCRFTVYIGYRPAESVIGLSKFARIAVALGKRPVMQEMYTVELADLINNKLKPYGVGVFVVGQHGCMQARGVKQSTNVTTSALRGVIRDRSEIRAEFFALVRGGNYGS